MLMAFIQALSFELYILYIYFQFVVHLPASILSWPLRHNYLYTAACHALLRHRKCPSTYRAEVSEAAEQAEVG